MHDAPSINGLASKASKGCEERPTWRHKVGPKTSYVIATPPNKALLRDIKGLLTIGFL